MAGRRQAPESSRDADLTGYIGHIRCDLSWLGTKTLRHIGIDWENLFRDKCWRRCRKPVVRWRQFCKVFRLDNRELRGIW